MASLGRQGALAPLTSADIPAGIIEGTDVAFLENSSGQNLGGTYSTERMYLSGRTGSAPNDYNYKLTGNLTVTGHLALGTIADEDVVITQDSTERTITGEGTLESGELLSSKETDLTGMTGELGSAVTFPVGHILQTKQSVMSTKQIVASASYVDVLTLSITPSSTSNKILINFSLSTGAAGGGEGAHIQIERDGTAIGVGDARGSRGRAFTVNGEQPSSSSMGSASGMYLDSPSSTSSLTYTIAVHGWGSSYPVNINCTEGDTDNANYSTAVSTLTLQEIQG